LCILDSVNLFVNKPFGEKILFFLVRDLIVDGKNLKLVENHLIAGGKRTLFLLDKALCFAKS